MKKKFTLRKHQILRHNKEIQNLFEKGQSINQYPLKAIFLLLPKKQEIPTSDFKVMFIVPKKNIRKSSHRNKIKRKIKESFRLLQHELIVPENSTYHLAFIYVSKNFDKDLLSKINDAVKNIIETLNKKN